MKKLFCVLLLVSTAGCMSPYTVQRVVVTDPPLAREEVERLTTADVSEAVIAEMIDKRGALALNADDLVALKKAEVPDTLVQKMIASERKPQQTVIVEDFYAYPTYGYPYYPYYSSVSWGVGVGYGWGHCYGGYPRGYLGVRSYR